MIIREFVFFSTLLYLNYATRNPLFNLSWTFKISSLFGKGCLYRSTIIQWLLLINMQHQCTIYSPCVRRGEAPSHFDDVQPLHWYLWIMLADGIECKHRNYRQCRKLDAYKQKSSSRSMPQLQHPQIIHQFTKVS